jgi:hypothetical protein
LEIILDELKRTLKYHKRQLEDNMLQIKNKEESISMLKEANEKHVEAINQIIDFIKQNEVKE